LSGGQQRATQESLRTSLRWAPVFPFEIEWLTPYVNNSREHGQAQISALMRSIQTRGVGAYLAH
jgi:hypothetical protein